MTRVYTIEKRMICNIIGEMCELPNCKNCGEYIRYKKSRLSVKEFVRQG